MGRLVLGLILLAADLAAEGTVVPWAPPLPEPPPAPAAPSPKFEAGPSAESMGVKPFPRPPRNDTELTFNYYIQEPCPAAAWIMARAQIWNCRRMKRVVDNTQGCGNVSQYEQEKVVWVRDQACRSIEQMQEAESAGIEKGCMDMIAVYRADANIAEESMKYKGIFMTRCNPFFMGWGDGLHLGDRKKGPPAADAPAGAGPSVQPRFGPLAQPRGDAPDAADAVQAARERTPEAVDFACRASPYGASLFPNSCRAGGSEEALERVVHGSGRRLPRRGRSR